MLTTELIRGLRREDARSGGRERGLTGFRESMELFAVSSEVSGRHGDEAASSSISDREVLGVNLDEVDVKFGLSSLSGVLECDRKVLRIFFSLESDGIVVITEFHNLGEVGDVETESHGLVASELLESFHRELEGNEGNMGRVHGLESDTSGSDIDVDVRNEVLDGLNDLLKDNSFSELSDKHYELLKLRECFF